MSDSAEAVVRIESKASNVALATVSSKLGKGVTVDYGSAHDDRRLVAGHMP